MDHRTRGLEIEEGYNELVKGGPVLVERDYLHLQALFLGSIAIDLRRIAEVVELIGDNDIAVPTRPFGGY